MKAFALLLKVLAGVVVIFAITITAILTLVDPNDYKAEITQAVQESTGRELSVGNMSLSIFPQLSIDLEQAQLSNAKGFSDTPFLQIEKIQIGAAILPLLSKELQVEALTLLGLQVNLEKNAQGITNWDDLLNKDTQQDSKDSPETSADSSSNPLAALSSLNFGGINIQNGTLIWQDQQSQQTVKLNDLKLVTGAVTFGEFFSVELQANTSVSNPQITSQLKLNLDAKLEQNGAYSLKNLALENTTQGQGIPVETATTKIDLPTFNLDAEQLTIPTLAIKYAVIGGTEFPLQNMDGSLELSEVSGDLASQVFAIKQFSANSSLKGDVIPSGSASVSLNTSASVDLNKQVASLNDLRFKAVDIDMDIRAQIEASQIIDNPQANIQLNIAPTNLKKVLDNLQITLPKMASDQVLQQFALKTQIHFAQKTESIKLNNLQLKLDNSNLSGSASVSNFAKPQIKYDLALDQINVSHYLPPKTATSSQPQPESSPQDAKIELPVQMLRDLDVQGSLKVGKLTYDNLKPSNLLVTTLAKNGDIKINPIKADIFKTRVNARAGLNVSNDKPRYQFATNTKNLPVGEIMKAFTGDDTLSGTGLVDIDITTQGERLSEFKKALNGKVTANLTDGAIKGFNLAQAIRQAKAKISGKTAAKSATEEKTDFSELNLKANIKNGIVTTQTLSAKAPFMRVNGSGSVNLPKETLDYLVKAKIVSSDKGQGGEELKDLNGLTIPVKLKGNYTSPDISLDLESLLQQKATAEIEKKKEKVVEDVKKKAEEKLKDLIPKGFKF